MAPLAAEDSSSKMALSFGGVEGEAGVLKPFSGAVQAPNVDAARRWFGVTGKSPGSPVSRWPAKIPDAVLELLWRQLSNAERRSTLMLMLAEQLGWYLKVQGSDVAKGLAQNAGGVRYWVRGHVEWNVDVGLRAAPNVGAATAPVPGTGLAG